QAFVHGGAMSRPAVAAPPRNRASGLRLSGGEVLGDRKQKQGDDEGELEADRPEEFRRIGIFLDVQEPLQPFDGGNGDNRAEQLQLETAEVALGDAFWPIRMLAQIDSANEIFIAGEDDDQDQVRHEGEIDEVQHADNDFFPGGTLEMVDQLVELDAGLVDENKNTGPQNQEKRRHQPPRDEDRLLGVAVGRAHDVLQKIRNTMAMPDQRRSRRWCGLTGGSTSSV